VKDDDKTMAVAVVCEKGGHAAQKMADYLETQDLRAAVWFPPCDVDEVDEAVSEGRFQRVIFPNLTSLLEAIWDQEVQFDQWLSAGTTVSFADGTESGATATVVFESWRKWHHRHRWRRIIAGAVLSAVALAAVFFFTLAVP
jgi:hypothetical protein